MWYYIYLYIIGAMLCVWAMLEMGNSVAKSKGMDFREFYRTEVMAGVDEDIAAFLIKRIGVWFTIVGLVWLPLLVSFILVGLYKLLRR